MDDWLSVAVCAGAVRADAAMFGVLRAVRDLARVPVALVDERRRRAQVRGAGHHRRARAAPEDRALRVALHRCRDVPPH